VSVVAALRARTAALHARLEDELMIVERLADPAARGGVLHAYFRLYAGAEAALEPWLADTPGLDFHARRKTEALAADLRRLGEPAASAPPPAAPVPPVTSRAHALGFAYVLEGASLGGRVIEKRLAARGAAEAGLRFLHGYGAATSARWKAFCAVLERECAAAPDEAVEGAVQGFGYAWASLRP
jgi:heme oxygenase